ncbi:MAG: hypothetical protein ACI4FX_11355, partial [Agathobacter sp.]
VPTPKASNFRRKIRAKWAIYFIFPCICPKHSSKVSRSKKITHKVSILPFLIAMMNTKTNNVGAPFGDTPPLLTHFSISFRLFSRIFSASSPVSSPTSFLHLLPHAKGLPEEIPREP